MALYKKGSPTRIKIVKQSGFTMDANMLAEMLQKQWPTKKISIDTLHSALKSIGVSNYQADDLSILMNRLQAIGFTISK
jgi:hypothetical protein